MLKKFMKYGLIHIFYPRESRGKVYIKQTKC